MKRLFYLAALLIFLTACATSSDRQFSLNQTLIAYEKALRWGNFAGLLQFRDQASEHDKTLVTGYDDVRVSGYQIKHQMQNEDIKELDQTVAISYFTTSDNRIRNVVDQQHWKYNDDLDRWQITSPIPVFQVGN